MTVKAYAELSLFKKSQFASSMTTRQDSLFGNRPFGDNSTTWKITALQSPNFTIGAFPGNKENANKKLGNNFF